MRPQFLWLGQPKWATYGKIAGDGVFFFSGKVWGISHLKCSDGDSAPPKAA
jgi:hypothetical protein